MEILILRARKGLPTKDLLVAFSKMLVFQDQYVQFVLGMPGSVTATYGFGEATHKLQALEVND